MQKIAPLDNQQKKNKMTISNPATTSEMLIILTQAAIMGFATYLPFIFIIKREFDKFRSQEVSEHTSGRSSGSFIVVSLFTLAISNMLYIVATSIMIAAMPDWDPILGENGITRDFWTLYVSQNNLDDYPDLELSMYNSILHLRDFLKAFAFFITSIMMIFSLKLGFSIYGTYQDNPNNSSIATTVIKIVVGGVIGLVAIEYYSQSTSWLLNLPPDGPTTIKELSYQYVTDAFETVGDGIDINNL